MSLRHAMLGLLTLEPMTGYELVKVLDDTIGMLWSAPHSQIYPELRRMEAEGLVSAERVPRGDKAEKRRYSVTSDGITELHRWETAELPYPAERDAHRLRCAYLEFSTAEAASAHLEAHLAHWSRRADLWRSISSRIHDRSYPLLKRRLTRFPESTHEAIVEFKALAFEGQLARAEMEVQWAKEALRRLERIEGLPEIQDAVLSAAVSDAPQVNETTLNLT